MPKFERDQCGACRRGTLIVEAEDIDVMREPRLVTADPHYGGQSVDEVLVQLQTGIGRVVIVACGYPCPFLATDNRCSIYPTRPNACVGMEAGDEQCQEARHAQGLPPMEPVATDGQGNLTT